MIISGDELKMRVQLAHANGEDNYYKCRKCGHNICWCCGDVCDILLPDENGNNTELCPCMNEGCECEV